VLGESLTLNQAKTVGTVIVIGDRSDATRFKPAHPWLAAPDSESRQIASLAAAMLELPQLQKKPRR
jgi:hypothetical protein